MATKAWGSAIGALLLALALALPGTALASGGRPPVPGTLIASEPLPAANGLADAERSLRIVYASTDGIAGKGRVVVSGALFLPRGAPPRGGWPVVAWAHGTVGIGDDCAPSRNPRSVRDATYLNGWLREGYAVVATDYQGLGTPGPHPYLDTRAEAYSVIDSVRAVVGTRFNLANKVIVVGQSQGAGAAFATAGHAAAYAPRIGLLGTIATGIPYLTGTLPAAADDDAIDPTIAYLLYIAAAAQQIDRTVPATTVFSPRATPLVNAAEHLCVGEMMGAVVRSGLTRRQAVTGDLSAHYARYLRGSAYPSLRVAGPVFVGTGSKDVDVPTAMQEALVRDACVAGSQILFHRYPGLDHSATLNPSFADSRLFAHVVLHGERIQSNCPLATRELQPE